MYQLYYSPGAASMMIHVALLEAGAPHELILVDIDKGQQKQPEYLKLNPDGVVPALVVDGQPWRECAALLLMLAERHPESGLWPAQREQQLRWREWLLAMNQNLHATLRFWFYPQELGHAEHPPEVSAALQNKIAAFLDKAEAHLNQHGPYLLGEQFSGIDLYLTMLMRWTRNMPRPATNWSALNQYVQRITSRPSWKKMMEIEAVDPWPRNSQV